MNKANTFIKRYTGVLPTSFNLDRLLSKNPIELSNSKLEPVHTKDRIIYLLSVIFYRFDKVYPDQNIWESEDYVHLCYKHLRAVIHNYKKYITYLIDNEIIETDGSWQSRRKCLGFRFTEKFRENYKKVRCVYVYDKKIFENLSKVRQPEKVKKKYPELYSHFDNLGYDESKVQQVLDEVYPSEDDLYKRNIQEDALTRLHYHETWTFRTGNTGRLYTPITNLKKELRSCLTYNGKELVEIDIKSSIPFMSLLFFNPKKLENYKDDFDMYASDEWDSNLLNCAPVREDNRMSDFIEPTYLENKDISDQLPTEEDILEYNNSMVYSSISLSSSSLSPHIMSSNNRHLYVIPRDIPEYIDDIKSGDIYQKIATHWNLYLQLQKEKRYSRASAKKRLLSILNSPSHWNSPEKKQLEILYPNVMSIFNAYNGSFKTRNQLSKEDKQESHVKPPFAYFTQSVESDFILNRVCGKIVDEYPHVPLFTIHDAIYTTEEFVGLVEEIISIQGLKYLGISPTVNVEYTVTIEKVA